MIVRPHWLRRPRHLARRVALVNSLQLLLVSGSLGWLTYSLGHYRGLEVSEQIRQVDAIEELSERLSERLSAAKTINTLNLLAISSGHLRLDDLDQLAGRFWRLMQAFPVSYINYGDRTGNFIGVERRQDGLLLLNEDSHRLGLGTMAVFSFGAAGERGPLLKRIPGMNRFNEEAWYTDAVRAGRSTWSAIYSWEDQPDVFSISYSSPVYGADRRLRGVIGVDLELGQLSSWLRSIWRHNGGLALIVEPDGRLVASSRPGEVLTRLHGRLQRTALQNLHDPLARALRVAKFEPDPGGGLRLRPGVLEGIRTRPVRINGREVFIDASPWGREEGLEWVLLTAVPANQDIGSTQRSAGLALMLCSAAAALVLVLTNRQIHTLLRPLNRLQNAATELRDRLNTPEAGALEFQGGIEDCDGAEMTCLASAISQLVERFNSLNAELLRSAERERLRDAQALKLLQNKLRSSLEAAAIAHEINQPLSVILWNCQLLLEQVRAQPEPAALPDDWRERIDCISGEAERVVATIETMRTLLRNVQTEPQRLDLCEVARSAVLYLRSSDLDPALVLEEQGLLAQDGRVWLAGDPVQIQIALVNLLRNAVQALADAGTASAWIGVNLERREADWVLSVGDNGPGFPPGFDAEAPLESTRSSGSGLGLFVVRTTMENHGGGIRFGRSSRGGALVSLCFPSGDTA